MIGKGKTVCTLIANTIHSKSSHHHHYHSSPNTPLIQRRKTPHKMARALIAIWAVFGLQILLVIVLCIPPLTCRQDLRNNLPLPPLLIRLPRHLPRNTFLLRIMIENRTPILRAGVWALAVRGRGVMHLVEEFEQLAVGYLVRVESDLEGFGMSSTTRAHGAITRALSITTNISYSCIIQSLPLKLFTIAMFDAPETSCCDCCLL